MKLLKNPWFIRFWLVVAALLILTAVGLSIFNATQFIDDLGKVQSSFRNRYLFSWLIEPILWVCAMLTVAFFAGTLLFGGKSVKTRRFLEVTAIVTASVTVTVGIGYLFYTVIPLHYGTFSWPYMCAYVFPSIAISTLMTAFVGFHKTKIRAISSRSLVTMSLLIASVVIYYFTNKVGTDHLRDQYFVTLFADGGLFLLAITLFGLGRSEGLWEVFVCKAHPPVEKKVIRQNRKKKKKK